MKSELLAVRRGRTGIRKNSKYCRSAFFSCSTTTRIDPPNLMLSRLFATAQSIFNPTSQTENNPRGQTIEISEDMVTTRQKGKPASIDLDGNDTITVESPRSSRKRQRISAGDVEAVVADAREQRSPTKKQKILPVRAKEDEGPNTSTRVVVEIPVSKIDLSSVGNATGSRKALEQSTKAQDVEEIEDSDASDEDQEGGDMEPEQVTVTVKSPPKLKSTAKASSKSPKKQADKPVAILQSTLPKPTHKRFGSDEPEPQFFSTAVENIEPERQEESSDEDEAPEVVQTAAAQKSIESKARDAARAIEE